MNTFQFNLLNNSIYELFWIQHDISLACKSSILAYFKSNGNTILSIANSRLEYQDVETILWKNQVRFEDVHFMPASGQ